MSNVNKILNSIICIGLFLGVFFLFGAFLEYNLDWVDFKNDESDRMLFLGAFVCPTMICLMIGPFKFIDFTKLWLKIKLLKYKNKSKITLK